MPTMLRFVFPPVAKGCLASTEGRTAVVTQYVFLFPHAIGYKSVCIWHRPQYLPHQACRNLQRNALTDVLNNRSYHWGQSLFPRAEINCKKDSWHVTTIRATTNDPTSAPDIGLNMLTGPYNTRITANCGSREHRTVEAPQ